MKKIVVISILSVFTCLGTQARDRIPEITIADRRVEKSEERVVVSFRADIGRRVSRCGKSVFFAPVITDSVHRWSLPVIVVQGRKARIATKRHDWAAEAKVLQPALDSTAIQAKNNSSVSYTDTIDWQPWMNGASLVAEMMTMGCCSYTRHGDDLLLCGLSLPPTIVEQPAPVVAPPPVPKSTGEVLAEAYPFIVPYGEFEALGPGMLFDEDREEALTVYFRLAKHNVERTFGTNESSLAAMVSAIREIQNSPDSRVRKIVIAGFASPEGPFNFNDRLAFNRATAVKRYIMDNTGMADGTIAIHNGSEDWRGLRMMVERSDMPSKERVLEIIDTVPVWDSATRRGRETELMRLDGGVPYRYMLKNFFPTLRNAAYIKIYYEQK
jgi:outer membrane protein OmpA-like peptidoglycan-associated protein